jgi:hypothetical protein
VLLLLTDLTNDNAFCFQVLLDDAASGRSSIDSIEGSELTNNSDIDNDDDDLDDADATNTVFGDRFSGAGADSFDTDEDDDENGDYPSGLSKRDRSKHPQFLIKCLKDSIISSLASSLLEQFLAEQQPLLQRYAKYVCVKNVIVLRPKLRPYSLPPRSLSQNRFSLPLGSSITSTNNLLQQQMMITSLPFRATPEPNMKLTSLLRVTPLRTTNSVSITTVATSPRKSQPSAPPPPAIERIPTSFSIERRSQQQQISLIGTAVVNLPFQLASSTPQPSQTQPRQTPSIGRYRSATTINTNTQNTEPITRLPPITIERLISSDQLMINRSNTITAAIIESIPPATRAVSGTSTGSNLSSNMKLRTLSNAGKLQRTSRSITISSNNSNKDLNNSSSTSPVRSITTTNIPSSSFKTTAVTRTHHQQQQQQQQKRPLVTSKAPPPTTSSSVIKISATRIC